MNTVLQWLDLPDSNQCTSVLVSQFSVVLRLVFF